MDFCFFHLRAKISVLIVQGQQTRIGLDGDQRVGFSGTVIADPRRQQRKKVSCQQCRPSVPRVDCIHDRLRNLRTLAQGHGVKDDIDPESLPILQHSFAEESQFTQFFPPEGKGQPETVHRQDVPDLFAEQTADRL